MHNDYFYISRLISGYITGNITEEEQKTLDVWRESAAGHERLFQELLDEKKRTRHKDFYYSFQDKIRVEDIFRQSERQKRRKYLLRLTRYAAVLALFITTGLVLYHTDWSSDRPSPLTADSHYNNARLLLPDGSSIALADFVGEVDARTEQARAYNGKNRLVYEETTNTREDRVIYHEIVVEKGGEYQLWLSDGTQVWLNSDSRLRFPVAFTGDNRTVELQGEAYFKVSRQETHPFIVKSGAYDVVVLGTEFNISNYAGDPVHRTVLVEGDVRIEDHITGEHIRLKPEDSYLFSVQEAAGYIEQVDVSRFTAWKEGKFRFYEEDFELIMNAVSRWYNMEVVYEDPALRKIKLSLFADRYQSITPLLKIFNEHGKVIIEERNQTLYIKKGR